MLLEITMSKFIPLCSLLKPVFRYSTIIDDLYRRNRHANFIVGADNVDETALAINF